MIDRDCVIEALRKSRRMKGLTLQQASDALKKEGCAIHPDSISRMESGHRGLDIAEFLEMAKLYNVKPGKLLRGKVVPYEYQ